MGKGKGKEVPVGTGEKPQTPRPNFPSGRQSQGSSKQPDKSKQ
jgi:hypothetical protein